MRWQKKCTVPSATGSRSTEEQKAPEPLLLDKGEIKEILESCGVPEQQVKNFSSNYNESFGAATDLPPKNIVNPSKFEVRTPDVVIRVAKGKEALVNTRVIDGRKLHSRLPLMKEWS